MSLIQNDIYNETVKESEEQVIWNELLDEVFTGRNVYIRKTFPMSIEFLISNPHS